MEEIVSRDMQIRWKVQDPSPDPLGPCGEKNSRVPLPLAPSVCAGWLAHKSPRSRERERGAMFSALAIYAPEIAAAALHATSLEMKHPPALLSPGKAPPARRKPGALARGSGNNERCGWKKSEREEEG